MKLKVENLFETELKFKIFPTFYLSLFWFHQLSRNDIGNAEFEFHILQVIIVYHF